ncbi:MAG: ribonuclease T [Xanthomonadales bacterium]|nr:ribonuclease T [Xanthomonadales bacterium]
MSISPTATRMAQRFRGFLPVVIDVETGGFDWERHALLEIAAAIIRMDEAGYLHPEPVISTHVVPFAGSELDPRSMEVNGIDPGHPFRFAVPEREALEFIFKPVRAALGANNCQRAILVGHNASFDLGVINAAVRRTGHKRNPFHPFSAFDTVTLGGLAYGQTVLSRAVEASGQPWDAREAHTAVYDTERTAELFCRVVNRWREMDAFWTNGQHGA